MLEKIDAAKIINNDELNAEDLNFLIEQMLEKDILKTMGENAKKVSIDNVEDRIYNEIVTLIKNNEEIHINDSK